MSKKRTPREARLFSFLQPIISLICGVAVDVQAPTVPTWKRYNVRRKISRAKTFSQGSSECLFIYVKKNWGVSGTLNSLLLRHATSVKNGERLGLVLHAPSIDPFLLWTSFNNSYWSMSKGREGWRWHFAPLTDLFLLLFNLKIFLQLQQLVLHRLHLFFAVNEFPVSDGFFFRGSFELDLANSYFVAKFVAFLWNTFYSFRQFLKQRIDMFLSQFYHYILKGVWHDNTRTP